MKRIFQSPRTCTLFALALAMVALIAAPGAWASEEAPMMGEPAMDLAAELSFDENGLPTTAFETEQNTVTEGCIEDCECKMLTTTATRVGATCLRARQNAAAAARAQAVCGAGSNGSCGPVPPTVAPCVPLTNGFSATATATYWCELCRPICH